MKRHITLIVAVALVICSFSGCSLITDTNATTETETTTTTTTTEPTTVTTTENENTTFKENSTSTIYSALKKDKDGDYPHKLATYTTYYASSNKTRTTNIKESISKINNIKIPDGKTFSFNQVVGKRTVVAGYQEAKVVQDGEFVDGLGGGVCQVSSTIFECVLRANLQIVSRYCHSLEISYVPLGGDATVQWNSTDFQFRNNTGTDIRLKLTAGDGTLTCSVYGKEKVDVGNVKINISKSGNSYTLTRTVDGKTNYTTYSQYSKPKTKS